MPLVPLVQIQLQTEACNAKTTRSRGLLNASMLLAPCFVCARKAPSDKNDSCRFRNAYRSIPRISHGKDHVFHLFWTLHYPVLVHNVGDKLQGRWSPQTFMASHGLEPVSMIVSRSGHEVTRRVKAAEFFSKFMQPQADSAEVIKLKDWPPSASFADKFKTHNEAFQAALPMRSYTRNDGLYNLAAHFPELPALKPDLVSGPKMYLATRDVEGTGSTALHLDVTSAVNILVYTSDEDHPGALWHIFSPTDLQGLREYLRSLPIGKALADPIHAQSIYLTPSMLRELNHRGIRPFTVHQNRGEAVFIPAGCAHQVSNTSACIKIACDFLCPESIHYSAQVAEEFRSIKKEDVLSLESTIWHAWVSLRKQRETVVASGTTVRTRHERKRLNRRRSTHGLDDQARRNQARQTGVGRERPAGLEVLRCPDTACTHAQRTFSTLDGIFNHM
ncbi:hypothetical protein C8Q78DRAFT_1070861 [Trametes maxima]|nr:hypothetical protein C8Q78DRAFT_1070861 [Trametes maxima]